jgi:hypothetical protein
MKELFEGSFYDCTFIANLAGLIMEIVELFAANNEIGTLTKQRM